MFDGDLLSERARLTPDKLALVSVESGERLTYARLDARIGEAADRIRGRGIEAGDRVGILLHNSIEFIALFFGAVRLGAIAVPLSTRGTKHEHESIAADCGMKTLFRSDDFDEIDLPDTQHPTPNTQGSDESIACLLYTSGTTGKPKGVMIPRRQLYWNGYNTAINWGLRDDDVSPVFTPLYHAGGLAAFMIPIFCAGGTIILHKGFDPAEAWRIIEQERCTVILGVPTIWKMLMEAPQFASVNLQHVRWLISGGAPLPAYIAEAYAKRGVPMKQGYGMTEVGVNCFSMTVEDSRRKPGSIGKPMLFTAVRIEGEETPGDVGEMLIRGPHVSRGYWNNEEATRAAYGDDGWFRTGDLARRDDEGFFYIAGRKKEMFISGGVNVYPAEIEAELVTHPLVRDAAIVPVEDATWGEVAVAFVVMEDRQSCLSGQAGSPVLQELEAYLATRIARYKLPRRWVFVDALPRTPYGKVVKADLRKLLVG